MRQQSVDGVLTAKVVDAGEEAHHTEEPADRVLGTVGDDDCTDRRKGYRRYRIFSPIGKDMHARGCQIQSQEKKA
jgi:hypothetical protein